MAILQETIDSVGVINLGQGQESKAPGTVSSHIRDMIAKSVMAAPSVRNVYFAVLASLGSDTCPIISNGYLWSGRS